MLPGLWALAVVSLVNGLMLLVSYIANNTFPQPLSEEEEAKYLRFWPGVMRWRAMFSLNAIYGWLHI